MCKIKLKINGNVLEMEENSTIQNLLDSRKIIGTMFVVERNLEIVPKDQYHQIIKDNDNYEIVGFFGGG
ncbi:MAG: sulfur carrier protein ThiS [Candidatus Gastranaerophilaceae bacterium]|jgi:thiamine biosynthesis protein ThiS